MRSTDDACTSLRAFVRQPYSLPTKIVSQESPEPRTPEPSPRERAASGLRINVPKRPTKDALRENIERVERQKDEELIEAKLDEEMNAPKKVPPPAVPRDETTVPTSFPKGAENNPAQKLEKAIEKVEGIYNPIAWRIEQFLFEQPEGKDGVPPPKDWQNPAVKKQLWELIQKKRPKCLEELQRLAKEMDVPSVQLFEHALNRARLFRTELVPSKNRNGTKERHLLAPEHILLTKDTGRSDNAKHYYFVEKQLEKYAEIKKAAACAVLLKGNEEDTMRGTGFLVGPGLILTNRHVIEDVGIDKMQIIHNGKAVSLKGAEILYKAGENEPDLALLKVPELEKADYIRLASKEAQKGDRLYQIGFPANLGEKKVVSVGSVLEYRKDKPTNQVDLLSDAENRGGNSGGPQVNEKGELVGVALFGRTSVFTEKTHAVTLKDVRDLLEKQKLLPKND